MTDEKALHKVIKRYWDARETVKLAREEVQVAKDMEYAALDVRIVDDMIESMAKALGVDID